VRQQPLLLRLDLGKQLRRHTRLGTHLPHLGRIPLLVATHLLRLPIPIAIAIAIPILIFIAIQITAAVTRHTATNATLAQHLVPVLVHPVPQQVVVVVIVEQVVVALELAVGSGGLGARQRRGHTVSARGSARVLVRQIRRVGQQRWVMAIRTKIQLSDTLPIASA